MEKKINVWLVPFLLSVVLLLGGWNLAKTSVNAEKLAEITAIVLSGKEQRLRSEAAGELRDKEMMVRLDLLVSRREFEARMLSVEARLAECNVAIRALEVRLATLEYLTKSKP